MPPPLRSIREMTNSVRRATLAAALLAASLALSPDARSGDPAHDIKDKDVKVRLAAVAQLATGGAEADTPLLDALHDKDWEVVEHAAAALGVRARPGSLDNLIDL